MEAEGLGGVVQDVGGRPKQDDEQHQTHIQLGVLIGQEAHALADAGIAGDQEGDDHGHQQDDPHHAAGGHASQDADAGAQLKGALAQGGGHAAGQAEHAQDVDDGTDDAHGLLAQDGIQAGADAVGELHVIHGHADGDAGHAVISILRNAPVQVGGSQGQGGTQLALGGIQAGETGDALDEVGDGLGNAPEHDAGGDAAAQGDDEPAPLAHNGLGVLAADLNAANFVGEHDPHTEGHQTQRQQIIQGAELSAGEFHDGGLTGGEPLRGSQAQDDDRDVQNSHRNEDWFANRNFFALHNLHLLFFNLRSHRHLPCLTL